MATTLRYSTDAGPTTGPVLYRDGHGAIGVLRAPDNRAPVGMALGTDRDRESRSLYRLIIHGADVPGRWVVGDREFRPASPSGNAPCEAGQET